MVYLILGLRKSSDPIVFNPLELKYISMDCSKGFTYSSLSNSGITTTFEICAFTAGFFQLVIVTGEPQEVIMRAITTAKRLK
jgi:hypothetical protein